MTKLTIAQVRDIKFGNAPVAALKVRHNVTKQTIYEIRKGLTWKHIEARKVNGSTLPHPTLTFL